MSITLIILYILFSPAILAIGLAVLMFLSMPIVGLIGIIFFPSEFLACKVRDSYDN